MRLEIATNNTVKVAGLSAYRKGEYFWKELVVSNSATAVWTNVSVTASNETAVNGNIFVPKTAESFGYDADGNLTSDGRWGYIWDGENRLVKMFARNAVGPANSLKFEYDWKSRRIHKQVFANTNWTSTATNDLRFAYDGWNLLDEISGSSTQVRGYLWGLDLSGTMRRAGGVGGLLEVNDPTNGTAFAAFDGNGNVAALLSTLGGTNLARYDYGVFGETLRASGPTSASNPVRFSTEYADVESSFCHYPSRFYSPSAGGWLSRDPAGEWGGLNLLAFVGNTPATDVDPFGLVNEPGAFGWGNYYTVIFQNPSTGDNSSAYGLGVGWLSGLSPSNRQFSGDDKIARQMRDTREAQKARDALQHDLALGCRVGLKEPFERHLGDEGIANFYAGFWGDMWNNPSRAFMGSFSGEAKVVSCFSCCAIVRFTGHNTSGWKSATRLPPPFGYKDPNSPSLLESPLSGQVSSILPDNLFGPFGRNVNETFSWTELICPSGSPIKE